MILPFNSAISDFFKNHAPEQIRSTIRRAEKDEIVSNSYPYSEEMRSKTYVFHPG